MDKLFAFLELENIHFTDVTLENLETFSAGLRDIGIHPRSQARILSGIRSFFRFLLLEDYIQQDPSELLESPQIGKHLPDVLTVEEIDTLIGSIDRSTREGQRNRAILETLYSCGLRVSELCNLKLSDLYLKEKFIKVEGKGSKQRLVPISSRAIRELELYFPDRNEGLIKPDMKILYLSAASEKHFTHHGVPHHQRTGRTNRTEENHQPSYFPPFLRYPSAGRRSQSARHTVHARA